MTATPSETHEAALSDERLREIIDGCKGVTPGPWKRYERASAAETRVHSNKHEVCTIHWERNGLEETAHRDGEYLARLDPDTVRALATELLARRTQPSAGEPAAVKEAVALSLDGLPPVQIENLHYFKNDAPAPFDAPAIKAMARELLAYRTICQSPLYATPPDQSRVERLEAALNNAEAAFESIRLTLINDLAEPGRTAFWTAVSTRDTVRQALHAALVDRDQVKP